MPPQEHLDQVAGPNALDAIKSPGNVRFAINAIMTLDGFFGMLHAALFARGRIQERSDDQWKEVLAKDNDHYRRLRDAAYMLKHGLLSHPKPRLIRKPEQILAMPGSFDAATVDRAGFDTETVWLACEDTDYRADEMIKNVLQLARDIA
jgi:hypothetical protein